MAMTSDGGGGTYKKPVVKAPVRQVSQKPAAKTPVKPPVKTAPTSPSKQKKVNFTPNGTGLTPQLATRIVNENYGGDWRRAYNNFLPGAVNYYMRQGLSRDLAKAEAASDFGMDIDSNVYDVIKPQFKYNFIPSYDPEETQTTRKSAYQPKQYYSGGGGGGGGGGGYAPPPPAAPDTKIRTASGIRRSPYWTSEDPYQQEFEPRFVVLGNQQAW